MKYANMRFPFAFLIFFFTIIQSIPAQEDKNKNFLFDNFFSHDTEHADYPKFVQDNENFEVLNFSNRNSEHYDKSKVDDEKIKNVFISFSSNDSLAEEFIKLQKFSKLEFLEIKTSLVLHKKKKIPELILPPEIIKFQNLKYLQISGLFNIDFEELFEILKQLPNLKYLGLTHGETSIKIPPNISEMKNLEGLKILGFKEISVPEEIAKMKRLTSLFLETFEGEQKVDLSFISKFSHIKKLGLYHANLDTKSLKNIEKLEHLEVFNLVNSNLEDPEAIIKFLPSGLKEIHLINFKTGTGSLSFEKFSNLEILELQTNVSYSLAPFDYKLEKLKSLTIHSDSLKKIRVDKMSGLKTLNLGFSNLSEFPKGINKLHLLEQLTLKENLITVIPSEIKDLENLKILDLSKNRLKTIEPGMGNLKDLEELHLSFNFLTALPDDFTMLKGLKTLNLNANELQDLPSEIGNLKNLIDLNLGDNYIKSLPESVTELPKIEKLDVSHNHLSALPEKIGNLKTLKTLILGGNKGQEISYYSISEKNSFDNNRNREFNQIEILPNSFSKLPNIKRLYFKNLSTLDSENLFQTLFNLPSKKYRVEVFGVGIEKLPTKGWENFFGETLEMGGSVIDSIPKGILKAPYLERISFKLNEGDGLSYSFNSRSDFLVFAEEQGFIDFQDIEKSEEMAKAYLGYGYGKKYRKDKDNIIEIFNKAFLLNSAYTASNIRAADYARALSKDGAYEEAIAYYTKAIEKDTLRGPYVLNFIIPHFKERAELQLKVGDSLDALEGLAYFSGRFDRSSWASTALLARKMDKDSLAQRYFEYAEEDYLTQIQFNKEQEKVNFLEQLSLLELYFISEDFEKAASYLSELEEFDFENNDELVLMKFFETVNSIICDLSNENTLDSFIKYVNIHTTSLNTWSFELFENWLEITERLSDDDKIIIRAALPEN